MFNLLTQNLNKIFDKMRSSGVLSEENIESAIRQIRIALLEADVALPVVKDFINEVKSNAIGQKVIKSISPGKMMIKIIHDEMIKILSMDNMELNLQSNPPINFLLSGLQGSGKTTASAKLALKLKQDNYKILLVSLDNYRPAAKKQLEILAKSVNIDSLPIIDGENPIDTAQRAMKETESSGHQVVIYDTAGRLHVDDEMLIELAKIQTLVNPLEHLLVLDSMIGQDVTNIVNNFNSLLNITGMVLSRIDGDNRGGAALSVTYMTKKPIKLLSNGEKLSDIEIFDPKRLASRILDMGDIVSLVDHAGSIIDQNEYEAAAKKMRQGTFNLNDYLSQIKNITKLGGFSKIISMLPGVSKMTDKINANINEKTFRQQEAIILSMTKKERNNYKILNGSRKKRIAQGSGTSIQQVNILLKQFKQISEMMKKAGKMDPKKLMSGNFGGLSKFLPK
ncbi:MAG: signal recognition particle protein [Rickettsiaceae bacterium]